MPKGHLFATSDAAAPEGSQVRPLFEGCHANVWFLRGLGAAWLALFAQAELIGHGLEVRLQGSDVIVVGVETG